MSERKFPHNLDLRVLGDPEVAVTVMDDLVEYLCFQDWSARQASESGNQGDALKATQAVGEVMGKVGWSVIPTIIMHFATHVNLARRESALASETCGRVGWMLQNVVAALAEKGSDPSLLAEILDVAKEMQGLADKGSYEAVEFPEDAS